MGTVEADLTSVAFRIFTPEEILSLSVLEIKTPLAFNTLDHPIKDGLYDLIMGPSGSFTDVCETCKQSSRQCPGHFGHIQLPLPVVNPLFYKEIATLLKVSCLFCYKILIPSKFKCLFINQIKFLELGLVTEAQELDSLVRNEEYTKIDSDDAMVLLIQDDIDAFLKESAQVKIEDLASKSTKTTEALYEQFFSGLLRNSYNVKSCPFCKNVLYQKRITPYQNKLLLNVAKVEVAEKFKEPGKGRKSEVGRVIVLPEESRTMLRQIWKNEEELMKEVLPVLKHGNVEFPTDLLYLETILVGPPKTRPVNFQDGRILENSQNRLYKAIINDCIILRHVLKAVQENSLDNLEPEIRSVVNDIRGNTATEKLHQCWLDLQGDVDHLLDADLSKMTKETTLSGLKQIIEKKEGILRMHMMGKRVNYAARSVITPDPNLRIDEIGIPEHFAKKLTYPARVTYFNAQELRKMVINGPDVYPGATLVENENGFLIRLLGGKENKTKRVGVAKLLLKSLESDNRPSKIVHRHLLNDDVLLLNRQPTLHRPSIMAHRVRILKTDKTLRMHYSNCKSYNADFDGDEMNAHFPQSEMARSEAYNMVNVTNHYLVPKDGTPLGGLIQDHVISGVRLTMRGKFFNKYDYQHLVYQGLSHLSKHIELLPPAILKPKRLWSGKQIISTILINVIPSDRELISLNASAKIGFKSWESVPPRAWKCGQEFKNPKEMSESEVIIRKGQLLCGVLDKQHYGATAYGLTHCLFELYGGICSSRFLDSLGRLFTAYLQMNGFTIGVKDILVVKRQDQKRKQIIKLARKIGDKAASKALDLDEVPEDLSEQLEEAYYKEGPKFKAKLDQEYKKALDEFTNDINKVCLSQGLLTRFPENNLQLMVTSGAKGSTVNTMQISCLLGQIELEGKRPPWMISGKSLPSFKPFETAPVAGGYIDGRFMTGINPQDFFFHCMAGREGLIDTAVKTSRSGYLQRCLIKHLEGVTICYDGTVRDHDNSVVQFFYGGDGLEVQKSTFLIPEQMEFLYENRKTIVDENILKDLKESTDLKGINKYNKQIKRTPTPEKIQSFTNFSRIIRDRIADKHFQTLKKGTGRIKAYSRVVKKWNKLSKEEQDAYKYVPVPDPITSKYRPHRDFGVISEKLEKLMTDYLETKEKNKEEITSLRNMIGMKYMTALCPPGEPVGLLAAQSVGEPSTQMTLNTFHFAGRGDMNVTLGIPRLREILMTASSEIKTPSMDIPLIKKSAKKMEKRAKKLQRTLKRVTLSNVLEKITVKEKLQTDPSRVFTYTVRFDFLPHQCFKHEFVVKPKRILDYVEKIFMTTLSREIRRLGKKQGDIIHESKGEKAMAMTEEKDNADEVDEVDAAGIELQREKNPFGENHESSDEDEELDDDDATKARLRSRHKEHQDYEEPDESEMEESEDEEAEETQANMEEEIKLTEEERIAIQERKRDFLETFSIAHSYEFDHVKAEWCEMVIGVPLTLSKIDFSTVLRELCDKAVLYEIPCIKRGILYERSGDMILKTEGINLNAIFQFDKILDLKRLYSNHVHQVAETYGIEAAVRVIVKELKDVFGVYGITVDPRHLLLIADYMTHQGVFVGLNRTGMADSASPFQQMSFESSTGFLKKALFRGKEDMLRSPSARLMVGKQCLSGTGCFDVINDTINLAMKQENWSGVKHKTEPL